MKDVVGIEESAMCGRRIFEHFNDARELFRQGILSEAEFETHVLEHVGDLVELGFDRGDARSMLRTFVDDNVRLRKVLGEK